MNSTTVPNVRRSTNAPRAGRWMWCLLALVAFTALSGCGRIEALAMIEERPTEVASAPGCKTDEDAARGWQYRSQVDMGEPPPSRAKRGKKSYVGRTKVTKEVETSMTFRSALVVVEAILLSLMAFLAMVALGAAFSKTTTRQRKLALLGATFALGLVAVVIGFVAGSVVSLDNPTNDEVVVIVNGEDYRLPPKSFSSVRVMSSTLEIETNKSGKLVEELSMSLDDGLFETLFRSTLGDGRYIYSVCGTTKYHLGSAKYE